MSYRQRAKDLIDLALDDGAPETERHSAAMKAIKIIDKHDLLSSPLDLIDSGNETVQAAKSVLEGLTDPKLLRGLKKLKGEFGKRRRRG